MAPLKMLLRQVILPRSHIRNSPRYHSRSKISKRYSTTQHRSVHNWLGPTLLPPPPSTATAAQNIYMGYLTANWPCHGLFQPPITHTLSGTIPLPPLLATLNPNLGVSWTLTVNTTGDTLTTHSPNPGSPSSFFNMHWGYFRKHVHVLRHRSNGKFQGQTVKYTSSGCIIEQLKRGWPRTS